MQAAVFLWQTFRAGFILLLRKMEIVLFRGHLKSNFLPEVLWNFPLIPGVFFLKEKLPHFKNAAWILKKNGILPAALNFHFKCPVLKPL